MGKLASKATKRIMASLLTIAMIMSNMTVYASEYSEPAAQTEDAVENTETGALELPSANDETVQDDAAQSGETQDETADDETSQEGTEGDAQETDESDENSNLGNDIGGGVSEPEKDGEEAQEPEAADGDIQESETGLEAAEVAEDVETPTPRTGEHTLWLVGDSTVCSFTDAYYYPRYGYGTQIGNYLDDTYTVQNLAASGRSSKNYPTEEKSKPKYEQLCAGIKSGDVLVIGFGHNDEKAGETFTDPNGDWQTEGSFAKSLYDNYVKIAEDAGATAILCTPIVRRTTGASFSNSELHVTGDGDYPEAIRKLGTDKGIAVVDLTEKTKALYEELGKDETLYLHAWQSSDKGSVDNTHLNVYGAKMVAYILAQEVAKISSLDISSHIINIADANKPTKANDLKSNPDYKEPSAGYNPPGPTDSSKIYSDYVIGEGTNAVHFKGTAFGYLGGNPSAANQILGTDASGNMHVQVANNKGKINSSVDGIAMYYYQVPKNTTFTLSAKATLTSIDNNAEVAFGLMARDDMYIDTRNDNLASDYVVAGSHGTGSNCFYRKSGVLGGKGTLKTPLQAGKDYNLSIVYNGDGYVCTFGDETPQSGGYDFQLLKVDTEYVYVGMFAARNANVTFSNIYLKVGDKVLADTRKQDYNITVTSDDNGTAEANNAKASPGSTVVLSATPNDGYMFKEWQITSDGKTTTSVDNQYTMPANDVTIKAVFEPLIKEWNFQTDDSLTGTTNGIKREGKGKNTTFYAKGLRVDATKGKWDSTGSDGCAVVSKDTTIVIPVKKSAYAKVEILADTKDYTLDYVNEATKAGENEDFVCDASKGEILLEITGPDNTAVGSEAAVNKIQYIKVTPDYSYTPPQPKNNIQVWDFGAKVEADTDLYTNNIIPGLIRKLAIVAEGGSYKGTGPTSFGDLDMNYSSGDRLYTNIPSLSAYNAGSYTYAQTTYPDGYVSAGAWYGNGAGNATQKNVTINKVKAGDKIVAYMGSHQIAGAEYTFAYTGNPDDASQKQSVTVSVSKAGEFKKFEFIAEYDGSYKIYQSGGVGGDGKIMYHRIMKMPVVTVSGTINPDGNTLPDNYTIRFYEETNKRYINADVDTINNTFTASLTPGYEYRAILNASGLGFTTETNKVKVNDSDCETCKIENVTLKVKSVSTYPYSGTITGFANGYDTKDLGITMVPDESATDANKEDLEIKEVDGRLTFSATLQPDVEYTIQMDGVYDYEVTAPESVNNDGSKDFTNQTITVALKPTYDVTGKFIGLGDSANVTKLTLTNVDDKYAYDVTPNSDGKGYSTKLRDGTYIASATVTGYSTKTHVVVNGKAVSRDIMFISTGTKPAIAYAEDIYVGYPGNDNNYDTVSEAVEACALMTRTATQRVTVHIAPGTYREQIIVTAPNISFVNDSNKEVLLTWYYGIGYKYYSADASGYYNRESAYDKFEKNKANRWGVAVYIKSTATAFRAKGITFENSFNRYITDEELDDGVELLNDPNASGINVVRNYKTDINSKSATERAAAIAVEADEAEFLNCGFYSSQDTVYTQGAHSYFKNCTLEGQTDYIFGSGNCVFDACELSWKGYSADPQGGYITANRPNSGEKGYLFRNCTVTGNNKLTVASGYFGRPWGAKASVAFLNTKLQKEDLIASAGWDKMNNDLPENANYKEYNTTTVAGALVSTSGRTSGTVIDATAAAAIKVTDYFGSWTPSYYKAESATLAFTTKPYVSDNGDANLPKAGHTLTVHYSLGDNDDSDASIIQWYSVTNATDNGTLLKSSTASVDKTYQIEAKTLGKYIKVIVTPQTISGNIGTPESFIMVEPVQEGYEDPSGGSDITLGDGINIFLAGDSTVKDYSENGMYEKSGGEDLGSWGEFIQELFDESKVKIQNYANGGRSTRNFINEGSLDKIKENIGEGDYLFIQFGHNDCSNTYADRYVPVGTPANGIYPVTPGTLESGKYPDGGQGTFKWFLKQYIDAAKGKGAIPVLVTPVARMYYNNGTIKPHHDDNTSSNNAYVTAMKQLADEENVLLIDGFELTKQMFENAWVADNNNSAVYGNQIMGLKTTGVDTTHNNKLGGLMEALLIAQAIQNDEKLGNIAKYVKAPSGVLATTLEGGINDTVFSINKNSELTAYDISSGYTERVAYWETIGQTMINAIKEKAAELNPDIPDDPDDKSVKFATEPHFTNETAPSPGTVLEVDYVLDVDANAEDASTIKWYRVEEGKDDVPLAADAGNAKKYTVVEADIGKKIKVEVTPNIKGGTAGTPKTVLSQEVTDEGGPSETVATPTADPVTGSTVAIGESITLGCDTEGASIYYTTNGDTAPTVEDGILYKNGIEIVQDIIGNDNKIIIKAIAVKDGMNDSGVAEFTYTYDPDKKARVSIPTANPTAGAVTAGTVVKLSTATKGADIYYIKGTNKDTMSDPDSSSTKYTEAGITINEAIVIKAIALKEGMDPSPVATFVYTIDDGSGGNNNNDDNKNGLEIILKKKDYTYTGSAVIPEYTVTYNGKPLIPDVEYTVKCSNNVKVADEKAKITVTGKGNMSGKTEETFNIKQKSLAKTDLSGAGAIDGDKLLALEGAKATPVLIYNGKKLAFNKDFEFADAAYKNKKDWTAEDNNKPVTVKAKDGGGFKDSRDLTVVFVSKEAQRNAKIVVKLDNTANKNITYDGTAKKPAFAVENKGNTKALVENTDYIVSYQSDITSAGKKTFTVTGISADCVGTVTKTYTVKPAPMDAAKVKVEFESKEVSTDNTKLKFVSTGVTFAKNKLKVKYDVKELQEGVDYKITYSANKKVGTGKYTVTGLGNYKGVKKTGQFTIEAAAMSDANVTVIVPDVALGKPKVYKSAPYVIEKDTNTLLKASNYKVTYWSDATATTPLGKSSEAGTAYVKIEGKGGYDSATSLTKSYAIKAVESTVQDLSTAKIAFYDAAGAAKPAKSFSYTGEAVQPYSMKITFKGSATPVEVVLDKNAAGFDNALYSKFDITFANNTGKGTASVIVKAKDDSYVGGKTATFKIAARNLNGFTWGSASTSSFFGLFK